MEKKSIKKIVYGIDELNDLGVYAISVVNMPAIESNFVALKAQGHVKLSVDKKRRMLFGPLLIPNKEILRIDDKEGEYLIEFPAETIERVAHLFLKRGYQSNATYEHQVEIDGMTLVESWIKEGDSDKSVHLGLDVPVGTWVGGMKVDSDDVWAKVESGEIKGFSIEGVFSQLSKITNTESAFLFELEQIFKSK